MSHPGTTTEGRIATGTDVHPRLVKESRCGHRRHPQLPANPGSRFVCVEDTEGVPHFPMEMSIWQHESAVSYRRSEERRVGTESRRRRAASAQAQTEPRISNTKVR